MEAERVALFCNTRADRKRSKSAPVGRLAAAVVSFDDGENGLPHVLGQTLPSGVDASLYGIGRVVIVGRLTVRCNRTVVSPVARFRIGRFSRRIRQ